MPGVHDLVHHPAADFSAARAVPTLPLYYQDYSVCLHDIALCSSDRRRYYYPKERIKIVPTVEHVKRQILEDRCMIYGVVFFSFTKPHNTSCAALLHDYRAASRAASCTGTAHAMVELERRGVLAAKMMGEKYPSPQEYDQICLRARSLTTLRSPCTPWAPECNTAVNNKTVSSNLIVILQEKLFSFYDLHQITTTRTSAHDIFESEWYAHNIGGRHHFMSPRIRTTALSSAPKPCGQA